MTRWAASSGLICLRCRCIWCCRASRCRNAARRWYMPLLSCLRPAPWLGALGRLVALITQQSDPSAFWPGQLAALVENRDGAVERRCGHIKNGCNRHERHLRWQCALGVRKVAQSRQSPLCQWRDGTKFKQAPRLHQRLCEVQAEDIRKVGPGLEGAQRQAPWQETQV